MPLRIADAITLLLLILGGVNWALVGLFDFDLITTVLDAGILDTGLPSLPARVLYVLIGIAAAWQVFALFRRILVPEQRPASTQARARQ